MQTAISCDFKLLGTGVENRLTDCLSYQRPPIDTLEYLLEVGGEMRLRFKGQGGGGESLSIGNLYGCQRPRWFWNFNDENLYASGLHGSKPPTLPRPVPPPSVSVSGPHEHLTLARVKCSPQP